MGKAADASKERYWRKVIGRQRDRGETVARFCAREGVPVHQFYWWKRTLRTRDRRSTLGRAQARQDAAAEARGVTASFLPVRLPFSTAAPIELVHPGGWVVRVRAGFDPQLLRQILAIVDPPAPNAGEN
ncbi:MAG: IS66 family insertion sequence element accessory protein TnpA [Planctomycetales bacterium]